MAFNLSRAVESQKALGPHPSFMDQSVAVSTYQVGGSRQQRGMISQRNAKLHADAYGGRQAIDHVYDAINIYADAISTADYRLTKPDGTALVRYKTDGTPPDHEAGPSDLYKLLDEPNEFMGYDEMISLLVIDLLLVGNGYWLKWSNVDGKPLKLFRLDPGAVKIQPGPHGPEKYEYKPKGVADPLILDAEDVIHFKRPNPHDPWYGMGVIQGAGRAMDLELAVTDTTAHYYENKADPSLIIQSERRVPRDVFNKIGAQMRAKLSGPSNAGALFILESGLKATTLDRTASDSMFDILSRLSRDRIYAKFRVSPLLFGIMDESSGQNKVSDLRRDFDNSVLRPFAAKLSALVSRSLASAWGVEFVIDHRSNLPADEQMKVVSEVAKLPGIKVREIRRLLAQFGIEESTGDKDLDELVLNKPGPEADANGNVVDPITGKVVASAKINAADQPLGSEAGRPPKVKNTKSFGTAGAKAMIDEMAQTLAELEGKALNAAGENVSVGRLSNEIAPPDTFAAARATDITNASRAIETGLRDAAIQLERDLLDAVEGKALKTSDIVSRVRNHEAWKTFRANVAEVLREGVISSARSGVMYSSLTPETDVDYDALADEIVNRRGGLNSIVKTLKDRVVNRVKDARQNDAERHDYNAEIKSVVNEWSAAQAQTVAETEAVHGYNEATLTAAELSGIELVYVTDGDDHDAPCQEADGSVWTIEEARDNRLEHPRCRRAFLPITAVG
jgi:HK97 family phage portal protein